MSTFTVTLNIFSGRPDPRWDLTDDQTQELIERLSRAGTPTGDSPPGALRGLGYRGFEIRQADHPSAIHVHGGVVGTPGAAPNNLDHSREIERFLLDTMPAGKASRAAEAVSDPVRAAIEDDFKVKEPRMPASAIGTKQPKPPKCPKCNAALAPAYNPGAWNIPSVQPYNNCYNYANNMITNTFAQPGRATGHMYTQLNNCKSVQPAAVSDGLKASPNFSAKQKTGYYVALVVWPGVDFHWYRQDNVGCWSHKPGGTAVRNYDNSGKPITDPKTADRGGYTLFCSYMITYPGHVHIQ